MTTLWIVLQLAVIGYCIIQAARDFRAKHYVWAAIAVLAAVVLLTMPFPTHSVTIDLPNP